VDAPRKTRKAVNVVKAANAVNAVNAVNVVKQEDVNAELLNLHRRGAKAQRKRKGKQNWMERQKYKRIVATTVIH